MPSSRHAKQFTHLFTVRLWRVPAKEGHGEIRGEAQHVLSGEVTYFSNWTALERFLTKQVEAAEESIGD